MKTLEELETEAFNSLNKSLENCGSFKSLFGGDDKLVLGGDGAWWGGVTLMRPRAT